MVQARITDIVIPEPPEETATGADRPTPEHAVAGLPLEAEAVLRELSARLRSEAGGDVAVLLRQFTEFLFGRAALVVLSETPDEAQRQSVRLFLERAARAMSELEAERQEAAIAKLADLILPDPLADARGPLALDNLELRDRFVAETQPLTSVQVSELAGSRGTNRYATAARWKGAGEIFSAPHRGSDYYPAFQFRDGRPHPAMRQVLAALPAGMSPWQRAFWFVSTNSWLGGKAPRDLLDDPEALLEAARREAQEVAG